MPGPFHMAIAYPAAAGHVVVMYSGNYQSEDGRPVYQEFHVRANTMEWPMWMLARNKQWTLVDKVFKPHTAYGTHQKLYIYNDYAGYAQWWVWTAGESYPCLWKLLVSNTYDRDHCDRSSSRDLTWLGYCDERTLQFYPRLTTLEVKNDHGDLFEHVDPLVPQKWPYDNMDGLLLCPRTNTMAIKDKLKKTYDHDTTVLLSHEEAPRTFDHVTVLLDNHRAARCIC